MHELADSHVVLVDVTLRDGGYVNGHSWSRDQALAIVRSCSDANILYSEVGYFKPRRHDDRGAQFPAECCPPDYLKELHATYPAVTLTVMAHMRDVELADYAALADCGIGLVRFPAQIHLIPALGDHVAAARDAGLQVTVNLIRVSEVAASDVARASEIATRFGVDVFYLADSNGSLFPEDVSRLVKTVRGATSGAVGFHAHDGLSLAFINSLAALQAGCGYLDASLSGMGKGGGNLPLELIAGYLRARQHAPYAMTSLAHTAAALLKPWKGSGIMARCESIASSLLDLNLDNIDALRGDEATELVSLIDAISN